MLSDTDLTAQVPETASQQQEGPINGERASKDASRKDALTARAAEQSRRFMEHFKSSQWMHQLSEAPTYRPTLQEFQDPLKYILSIRDEVAPYGIAKIVPPCPATSQCFAVIRERASAPHHGFKAPTRQQVVRKTTWHTFDEPRFWTGTPKALSRIQNMADSIASKVFKSQLQMSSQYVELEFWRNMAMDPSGKDDLVVDYGDEIEGTGFNDAPEDPLGSSDWNLNKVPSLDTSPLRLLRGAIAGVSSPLLYIGMLFSMFCWAAEESNLYTINYSHIGSPKTWYAVGAQHAAHLEEIVKQKVYHKAVEVLRSQGADDVAVEEAVLRTLAARTTMFSPDLLLEAGLPVTRCIQGPGEFVVTFPRTYTSGFCHGLVVSEAIKFAHRNWFELAADAALRFRFLRKQPAIPLEQLVCHDMSRLVSSLSASAAGTAAANNGASASTALNTDWLISHGPRFLSPSDVPLITTFCRLLRWTHRRLSALFTAGAERLSEPLESSVICSESYEALFFAAVMPPGDSAPLSLRSCPLPKHALHNGGSNAANNGSGSLHGASPDANTGSGSGGSALAAGWLVMTHANLGHMMVVAEAFTKLCAAQGWGLVDPTAWAAEGLSDRLSPLLATREEDYHWEDLTVPYSWHTGASNGRADSPGSSSESASVLFPVPHMASPGDEAVKALMDLLPPAASPIPRKTAVRQASGKSGKRAASGKGARTATDAPQSSNMSKEPSGASVQEPSASRPITKRNRNSSLAEPAQSAQTDAAGATASAGGAATLGAVDQKPAPQRRQRASRVSAVSAIASWQQNATEPDTSEESGSQPGKRRKKNGTKVPPQSAGNSAKREGPESSSMGRPPAQWPQPRVHSAEVEAAAANVRRQQAARVGDQMQGWQKNVDTVNHIWLKKLSDSNTINKQIRAMLLYFLKLPPVAQVYPLGNGRDRNGPAAPNATVSADLALHLPRADSSLDLNPDGKGWGGPWNEGPVSLHDLTPVATSSKADDVDRNMPPSSRGGGTSRDAMAVPPSNKMKQRGPGSSNPNAPRGALPQPANHRQHPGQPGQPGTPSSLGTPTSLQGAIGDLLNIDAEQMSSDHDLHAFMDFLGNEDNIGDDLL